MSLYWIETPGAAPPGPRVHAFVIGVGAYDHLGLGSVAPARLLSGLKHLTTTPLAAKAIAQWLKENHRNTACPMGSIELLLSPVENLEGDDGVPISIEAANMANIRTAFARWLGRCNTDPNNIALFYFAGHGISAARQFLLPSDFGDPARPNSWENCIDFTGFQAGMGSCKAQTQLFFVDACRDTPNAVLSQKNPNGDPLISAGFGDEANVSAAYCAAMEGRQAYGRDGEPTYFCKALLPRRIFLVGLIGLRQMVGK